MWKNVAMSEDEESEIYVNGKCSRTQSKRIRDLNSLRKRITEQIGKVKIARQTLRSKRLAESIPFLE